LNSPRPSEEVVTEPTARTLTLCVVIIAAAMRLIPGGRRSARLASFDVPGAVLVTAGMLLVVYALVKAPEVGWRHRHTIGELGTAMVLLAVFVVVERRSRDPLFPFGILRIKGLAAANATQLIAFAGFLSVFFFLTLYMQNVLGYTPIQSGSAYLPVTAGIVLAAGASAQLVPRIGTRPVIVAGALIAAVGIGWLARIPVHGTYLSDLLPGLAVMSIGLGAVFVTVTTAANAGVPARQAGLAAGLLNTSLQLGSALGLAVFAAIATARTNHLLTDHAAAPLALTSGYRQALLACTIALLTAGVIALRATNTRGHTPSAGPSGGHVLPTTELPQQVERRATTSTERDHR
jgi:hypothetical protein